MTKKRLLVLDGHSMAFRAFYALPAESFVTSTGQTTNAVYGFTSMLVKMLEDYQPTHILAAFDAGRESFRNEVYPEYKGGREKTPEEFKPQVPLIQEVLAKMNIKTYQKEGIEADDILATIAAEAEKEDMEVLLASGDRDSFQLISDKTMVIYPGRSTSDLRLMDAEAVEDRYGVTPERYPHLAALVGETADNLPGVPGVGEKTAAQWLKKYDGLEGVIAHADDIGGKRGQALRDHLDDVRRNRQINQLLRDADIDVHVDQLERQPMDRNGVEELFDTLEFTTLRSRVFKVDIADIEEDAAEVEVLEIQTFEHPGVSVKEWAKDVDSDKPLVLRVFVSETDNVTDIKAIVLLSEDRALVVEPTEISAEDEEELTRLLTESKYLVTHEAKKAKHLLVARGLDLDNVWFETELAAYLLRPDQRGYQVPALARRYLDRSIEPEDTDGQTSLFADHSTKINETQAIGDLVKPMTQALKAQKVYDLFNTMELPVQSVLWDMEHAGIGTDRETLEQMSAELGDQVQRAATQAREVVGKKEEELNLSSPKQLQVVLFDELNMPKTRRTKTGYTTNAEALQKLYAETQHPFLAHLLEHRDKIKLQQTVDGLINSIDTDGRIHTTFQQTIAATGRLSSTDPNLQNIPMRTEEGRKIRDAFVPGEGYDNLLTADYSQIEMRIMAHMSKDEALIEAFKSGEDLHSTMASMVFHVPVDEVDSTLRSRIKATSYGLAYGLSTYGLSQQLRIPQVEAGQLRDKYFERFGGVNEFLEGIVDQARKDGYTETLLGRRRYLPDLRASNYQRRSMAERAALNAPIQGSAADIIKIAMINLQKELEDTNLKSRMLLQVHDELVLEVIDDELEQVKKIVNDCMQNAIELSVPLDVSMGIGKTWREAGH